MGLWPTGESVGPVLTTRGPGTGPASGTSQDATEINLSLLSTRGKEKRSEGATIPGETLSPAESGGVVACLTSQIRRVRDSDEQAQADSEPICFQGLRSPTR
jgi:hypothetical protein